MGISRAETRRRWEERLARFVVSACTVAQFCAAEQVSVASFYLWRRRLRERASAESPEVVPSSAARWLPVMLTDTAPARAAFSGPTLDLELPNRVCLRMPRDIEVEFVGQLLTTVARLAPGRPAVSGPAEVR